MLEKTDKVRRRIVL